MLVISFLMSVFDDMADSVPSPAGHEFAPTPEKWFCVIFESRVRSVDYQQLIKININIVLMNRQFQSVIT